MTECGVCRRYVRTHEFMVVERSAYPDPTCSACVLASVRSSEDRWGGGRPTCGPASAWDLPGTELSSNMEAAMMASSGVVCVRTLSDETWGGGCQVVNYKFLGAFVRIHGVEVMAAALMVQESPTGFAYVSYFESVRHATRSVPGDVVSHDRWRALWPPTLARDLLVAYFACAEGRGVRGVYIWSMPAGHGQDYVFRGRPGQALPVMRREVLRGFYEDAALMFCGDSVRRETSARVAGGPRTGWLGPKGIEQIRVAGFDCNLLAESAKDQSVLARSDVLQVVLSPTKAHPQFDHNVSTPTTPAAFAHAAGDAAGAFVAWCEEGGFTFTTLGRAAHATAMLVRHLLAHVPATASVAT